MKWLNLNGKDKQIQQAFTDLIPAKIPIVWINGGWRKFAIATIKFSVVFVPTSLKGLLYEVFLAEPNTLDDKLQEKGAFEIPCQGPLQLVQMVTVMPNIARLDMSSGSMICFEELFALDDPTTKALSELLSKNKKALTALNLNSADIKPEQMERIASQGLKNNKNLKQLILSNNRGIGSKGFQALADVLNDTGLQELNLTECGVGCIEDEVFKKFVVESTKTLNKLDLSGYGEIGSQNLLALADALKGNPALEKLNLHGRRIGDAKGMKALTAILASNKSLKKLILTLGLLYPEGMPSFAKALGGNKNIKTLGLHWGDVNPRGVGAWKPQLDMVKEFAKGLKVNTTITSLRFDSYFLDNRSFPEEEEEQPVNILLRKGLQSNNSLKELNLSYGRVSERGLTCIIELLKNNTRLVILKLFGSEINDVAPLLEVLSSNKTLALLDLRNNPAVEKKEKALSIEQLSNERLTVLAWVKH